LSILLENASNTVTHISIFMSLLCDHCISICMEPSGYHHFWIQASPPSRKFFLVSSFNHRFPPPVRQTTITGAGAMLMTLSFNDLGQVRCQWHSHSMVCWSWILDECCDDGSRDGIGSLLGTEEGDGVITSFQLSTESVKLNDRNASLTAQLAAPGMSFEHIWTHTNSPTRNCIATAF
jgi:hypothetical protein